ncbi:TPA: hypothetical protein U1V47_001757, partial [Streptococcus suis]|nr:hypothetical protein [Streptococcus suis]HEM3972084.1 hypothetical protein [Streptococcus suis]HEM3976194.1 hypothetical protein [Streptococcus suis]HEM3984394.1 hypothetical protein [Streptococcus suis]HEM3986452.1 hypothetical protein [Streptococcus suis]
MDGYLKLDKMLDWQVANYPLRMSEKARLMALPGDDFCSRAGSYGRGVSS